MNMVESVKTVYLKKYLEFNGRASRAEYWWSYLFIVLAYIALSVIGAIVGQASSVLGSVVGILAIVFILASILPGTHS